jgi:hypothetical protein
MQGTLSALEAEARTLLEKRLRIAGFIEFELGTDFLHMSGSTRPLVPGGTSSQDSSRRFQDGRAAAVRHK